MIKFKKILGVLIKSIGLSIVLYAANEVVAFLPGANFDLTNNIATSQELKQDSSEFKYSISISSVRAGDQTTQK